MTAADKYYLKARDNYPYNLDDALEALEYGLSCDDTHAGLLTLQGNIYANDLKQFNEAKQCFELALFHDHTFVDAYYAYIRFTLRIYDDKKAGKLIHDAMLIKGINKALILYFHALLLSQRYRYAEAINKLKVALRHSQCKECYTFYTCEQ